MNIIFEGNECTYKTTTAKRLAEEIGFTYMRGSSFDLAKRSEEELYQWYRDLYLRSDQVVFDRGPYSNRVYAALYEGFARLTDEHIAELQDILNSETVIIFCTAPTDVIVARLRERGDDIVTEDRIDDINNTFDHEMAKCRGHIIHWQTHIHTVDQLINAVKSLIQEEASV